MSADLPGLSVALPVEDETIARLSAEERELTAKMWLGRARSELGAAANFSVMARRLIEQGASFEISGLAARAVADEVEHAEICRRVAARYLGREAPWPQADPVHEPSFGVAGPELTTALCVVLNSCMSETIGSAFLRTCLANAEGPLVRSAMQQLLRDEITHARIGWAYLSSGGIRPLFQEIAQAVPALIRFCRRAWLASEGVRMVPRGHGGLPHEELRAVVEEAFELLVLPGLRHVGVPVPAA